MKPFHEWVAESEGKVEDTNSYMNSRLNPVCKCCHNKGEAESTEWQIRKKFVDLCYPELQAGEAHMWMSLFCSAGSFEEILGNQWYRRYMKVSTNESLLAFLTEFKQAVSEGNIKEDYPNE